MEILHDDKHITVCIKVPGLLSEKSESGNDILTVLDEHYKSNGQAAKAYSLHRLDHGVGGVMVFSKTHASAAKMSALIAEGKLEKEYLAVVFGKPEKSEGVFEDLLFKDSKKNKSFVVNRKRAGVREAKLSYVTLDTQTIDSELYSLVRIKLYTGRSHQIRVQFSSRKLPLYGDRKYGAPKGRDIALWSHKLTFTHPFTGKEIVISALPEGGIWDEFDLSALFFYLH